jgi:hypothetical protein
MQRSRKVLRFTRAGLQPLSDTSLKRIAPVGLELTTICLMENEVLLSCYLNLL